MFNHTLAHGVALVRIWNAGLKCTARGVEQRAPPMFGRATIRLGIGPHSSLLFFFRPPNF